MAKTKKAIAASENARLRRLLSSGAAICGSCGRVLRSIKGCSKCAGLDPLARALCCIGRRPGVWLRSGDSLGEVEAFITGFQHGSGAPFGPGWFAHFTRWVELRYKVNAGCRNGFSLIRERVKGNEPKAFQEFFRLLPHYIRDMRKIGPEGISARYQKRVELHREKVLIRLKQQIGGAATGRKKISQPRKSRTDK